MAHYLIYIPHVQGATDDHLRRLGLEQLLRDGGPSWLEVLENGPDGGRGMVATWMFGRPELDPFPGVDLARQHWEPAAGNAESGRPQGAFWIGWEIARPPMPAHLARRKQYAGIRVELHDGSAWMIPESRSLPHIVGLDADGRVAMQYAPEFERFCRKAEEYAVLICRQIGALEQLRAAKPDINPDHVAVDFELSDAYGYCCEALALNYRVCPEVVAALKILARPHIVAVAAATISLPAILEVRDQKKTDFVSIPVG